MWWLSGPSRCGFAALTRRPKVAVDVSRSDAAELSRRRRCPPPSCRRNRLARTLWRSRDLSSVLLDTTANPSAVIRLAARYKKLPSYPPKEKTLPLLRIVTRWWVVGSRFGCSYAILALLIRRNWRLQVLPGDIDLLDPPPELEKRRHKKKRLVQSPNSFFMVRLLVFIKRLFLPCSLADKPSSPLISCRLKDVKCQGCFNMWVPITKRVL